MTTFLDLGVASRDLTATTAQTGQAGHTADGLPLTATVALSRHHRADHALFPTTDHGAVLTYLSLDVSWAVIGRPFPREGALRDALLREARPTLETPTWAGLVQLWTTWSGVHLSPGCDHQQDDPEGNVRRALRANRPCPHDGWVFGSGWLRRPLPADVETRARQVMAALGRPS